jgi:hypothetical protein
MGPAASPGPGAGCSASPHRANRPPPLTDLDHPTGLPRVPR